jgi:hypothetical protein
MDAQQQQQLQQQLQQALHAMQQQQQQHAAQQAQIQQLQQQLQQQQAAQQAPAAQGGAAAAAAVAAAARAQPRLAAPPAYGGNAAALDGWLREMRKQCRYYGLTTDDAAVRFGSAQLTGAALDWWDSLSDAQRTAHSTSLADFEQALRTRFQPVNSADTARRQLDALQQGPRQTVHDYISAFRRLLSAVPDMSEADRTHRFLQGLRPGLQTQLRIHGVSSLDDAIVKASRIGSLSQFAAGSNLAGGAGRGDAMDLSNVELHGIEGLEESTGGKDESDAAGASAVVSRSELNALLQQQHKQLLAALQQQRKSKPRRGGGSNKVPGLTPEQVRERYAKGQCFACGESGHVKANCPKPKN